MALGTVADKFVDPHWEYDKAKHIAYSRDGRIDGLVQDCSNSIANALELLQCCTNYR